MQQGSFSFGQVIKVFEEISRNNKGNSLSGGIAYKNLSVCLFIYNTKVYMYVMFKKCMYV